MFLNDVGSIPANSRNIYSLMEKAHKNVLMSSN